MQKRIEFELGTVGAAALPTRTYILTLPSYCKYLVNPAYVRAVARLSPNSYVISQHGKVQLAWLYS